MFRDYGTNQHGNSFSRDLKLAAWEKAKVVVGSNANAIRRDICGALIYWDKYGDTTEGGYGWEIDHIMPVAKGGSDDVDNLQPLQWQNNRQKADAYPANNFCKIS